MFDFQTSSARFRFKREFRLLRVEADSVLISYLGRRSWVRGSGIGAGLQSLIELRNQSPSSSEFSFLQAQTAFSPKLKTEDVKAVLKKLYEAGILSMADKNIVSKGLEVPSYFERFSSNHQEQTQMFSAVRSTTLRIVSSVSLPEDWLDKNKSWWKAIEITDQFGHEEDLTTKLLTVVITEVNEQSFAMRINQMALHQKRLVLPVLIDAFGCTLGPIAGIRGQPCFNCLDLRRRSAQRGAYLKLEAHELTTENSFEWPDFYWSILEGVLISEAISLASECVFAPTWKNMLIHDFLNHRSINEDVYPVPGCPVCQREKSGV